MPLSLSPVPQGSQSDDANLDVFALSLKHCLDALNQKIRFAFGASFLCC